jgi:hypothetical protein
MEMSNCEIEVHRQSGAQPNVHTWSVGPDKGLHAPEIETLRIDAHRAFAQLVRVPAERLMWMTIIGSAIVVEPGDHSHAVAAALQDIERKLVSRSRRRLPGLRIRGVHEVDVLTLSRHMGPHKIALLGALGVDVPALRSALDDDDRRHEQRVLVPHLHCVIDLAQHTSRKVSEELRAEFPGVWRTLGKSLYVHRTIAENLRTLASYATKLKVAYSDSLGERPTKFGTLYEPEWRDSFVSTLQAIGLSNLLFRHGGS